MRSGRAILAVVLLAGGALPARAADSAAQREALGKAVDRLCRAPAGSSEGRIAPGDLARALFTSKVAALALQYDWVAAGPPQIAATAYAVSQSSALPPGLNPANLDPMRQLARLTTGWAVPGNQGRVFRSWPASVQALRLRHPDGTPWTDATWPEALEAVLAGAEDKVIVTCLPPPAAKPASQTTTATKSKPAGGPRLVVGRSPIDLAFADVDQRTPAEVSLLMDRDSRVTTLSVFGTVGLRWAETRIGHDRPGKDGHSLFAWVRPSAYMQLQRQSATANPYAIDNLAFGIQAAGFVQSRGAEGAGASHYFAINASYLTDTRFLSRSLTASAVVIPQIKLPGYDVTVGKANTFRWNFSGVLDYALNDRPGRKAKLIGAPSWTRIGFNAGAMMAFKLTEQETMELSSRYGARYTLSSGPGRADMLSLGWTYRPDLNISFGLAYDHGTNLDSLVHASTIKAIFGFRN